MQRHQNILQDVLDIGHLQKAVTAPNCAPQQRGDLGEQLQVRAGVAVLGGAHQLAKRVAICGAIKHPVHDS